MCWTVTVTNQYLLVFVLLFVFGTFLVHFLASVQNWFRIDEFLSRTNLIHLNYMALQTHLHDKWRTNERRKKTREENTRSYIEVYGNKLILSQFTYHPVHWRRVKRAKRWSETRWKHKNQSQTKEEEKKRNNI